MSNSRLFRWVKKLIPKKIVNRLESNKLARSLILAVSGTIGLRVANASLAFFISIILTRLLGASFYGSYAYALSWIRLAQIPAELGFGAVILKDISVYRAKSEWQLASGLLNWSTKLVFFTSVVVALLVGLLALTTDLVSNSTSILTIALALLSLPLRTLLKMRESAVKGFDRIIQAQLPQQLLQPVVFLVLLGIFYTTINKKITDVETMAMATLSFLIALLFASWSLNRYLPIQIKTTISRYNKKIWLLTAFPFIFTAGMSIINTQTDSLMLGIMQDAKAVGIYTVANRCTQLVSFVLVAVNSSIAPTFAALYSKGELQKLQSLFTKSSQVILVSSLPLCLGLIFFGNWFLLIFGSEFVVGHSALVLLSIGQLFNVMTGSVALLLNMTGNARDSAVGVAISAVLNVILNYLLIPLYGIQGAALATATSTILWNIILTFFVYKRLRIYPTPFTIYRKNKNN